MKTKHFLLLLALLAGVTTAQGAVTLKIGGENAIGNTELLNQYGITLGTTTVGNNSYPCLTLNNSQINVQDIGLEYSYSKGSSASSPATQPLYIVVRGICMIESTGSYGLKTNQTIYVTSYGTSNAKDSCSLYIKGTEGVYMQATSNISVGAVDGVELICEGTSGAGILGTQVSKQVCYGGVAVLGDKTSLIAKGSTCAMAAVNAPLLQDGAAIRYPSGLSFSNNAYATTEWMNITATGLPINTANFPDAAFRNFVNQNYDNSAPNHQHDGYLSRYERSLVTTMNVYQKNISDLTGVNYFTSLTSLNCGANSYATIDISNLTELENLQCYSTGLQSIDLSNNTKLQTVDLRSNVLAALDVSNNTKLTELQCQYNYIETLDVSMCPDLKLLNCGGRYPVRQLRSLNIEGCTKLEDLDCASGHLTTLDVSHCAVLKRLLCHYNDLTTLDVSGLTVLNLIQCNVNNNLTSLDVTGCTALEFLYCGNNPIAQLNLSDCTGLKRLQCENNSRLTQLDVSGKQLTDLNCSNCPLLTKIDCSSNLLEANVPINVSRCNALREIHCQLNKLSGAALDSLISYMPTITTEGTIYLVDEDNNDENECSIEQAIAIYNKGWNALRYVGGEWKPFEIVVISEGLHYKCILSNDDTRHAEVIGVESLDLTEATIAESVTVSGIEAPFPVTGIAANAFKNCSDLTAITIPDFIESIGDKAFDRAGLTEVTVERLTPLVIAEDCDPFPSRADIVLNVPFGSTAYQTAPYWREFKSVVGVDAIVIDEYTLHYRCFLDADGQPDHAEVVDFDSFSGYNMFMAESVTYRVGDTDMTFPVTIIAENAFHETRALATSARIIIPSSIQKIKSKALYTYEGPGYFVMMSATPPATDYNANTGANNPFNSNSYNARLIVPEGSEANYRNVSGPWNRFFNNHENGFFDSQGWVYRHTAQSLTSPVSFAGFIADVPTTMTIPDSAGTLAVTGIFQNAFAETTVENIIIPTSVTTIVNRAFGLMPNLKTIKVGWKENIPVNETAGAYSVFYNTDLTDVVLYVPAGTKSLYQSTLPWSNIPTIIEQGDVNGDGVVTIADVTALVNIILGKSEANAIADVNGDGSVTIADVTALVNIILGKN